MNYILNPCTDAQWNMAHDEFMLEEVPGMVFSLWQNAPAVIIGLNQNAFAEVNLPFLKENGIMLARRVTGGGAVYHDLQNLNYSIAGPIREMEDALLLVPAALQRLGIPVERTGRNDLTIGGKKCSGYAKRISRSRMLIHGTLMWDVDLDTLTEALKVPGSKLSNAGVESVRSRVANLKDAAPQFSSLEAFRKALHQILSGEDGKAIRMGAEQIAWIDERANEKFRRWEWIYGHSPAGDFVSGRRFPCGTIELQYSLRHGLLTEVRFGGDFLGGRPAQELSNLLEGKRLDAILELPVEDYFDGLSPRELLDLFCA